MPHRQHNTKQIVSGRTSSPVLSLRRKWVAVWLAVLSLLLAATAATPIDAAPAAIPAAYPAPPAGCFEWVTNGAFESPIFMDWGPQGFVVADSSVKVGGTFSARIGLTAADPNQNISSSIRQTINLPAGFDINLSFQWFPKYDLNIGDADVQFVNIQTSNGSIIPVIPNTKQNSTTWQAMSSFPLNSLAGQQITLIFGVNNDGVGSKTWMYVDDVSIIACPIPATLTPTPTITPLPTITLSPTPTPTTTPLPAGCVTDGILNGSFEDDSFWIFGEAPVPGAYVGAPVRSGLRAVRLGIDPATIPGLPGKESFSSIRQAFQISPLASTAALSWWHFDRSEEGPLESVPRMILLDRQEVVLLNVDLSTAGVLYSKRLNGGVWQQSSVDLTSFRGRPLVLYFNVLNDGNALRTWQFIDDVALTVCFPPTATPTPTSPATPTSAPTETPTPTITATDTPLAMGNVMGAATPGEGDPNSVLAHAGEPTVENVSAAGRAGSEGLVVSEQPLLPTTLWFGRPPVEVLTWTGVMLGGLAIIGMLAWLIRQYRGPGTTP